MNTFEKHPKTTIFIIIIGALLIIISALEFYLSRNNIDIRNPPLRHIRLREPYRNMDLQVRASDEMIQALDGLDQKKHRYRTDSNGFILPSNNHENPDAKIVFLGGSTTECMYMDEQDRFPYLVGKILEEKTNKKINTINAGFAGNNSMHSFNSFVNKIVPLQPQHAILMHNVNDLIVLLLDETYFSKNEAKSLIQEESPPPPPLKRLITAIKDSTFPNVYETLYINGISKIIYSTNESHDEWASYRGKKVAFDKEKIRKNFSSSINSFIYTARAWGINPILMTQFNRYKENPDLSIERTMKEAFEKSYGITYQEFRDLYIMLNETTREIAKSENVKIIDLEKLIPKEKEFMYDGVHLNKDGSRLAATEISKQLYQIIK